MTANRTFVSHDNSASFAFQKWIRGGKPAAMVTSITHHESQPPQMDGLSFFNCQEWSTFLVNRLWGNDHERIKGVILWCILLIQWGAFLRLVGFCLNPPTQKKSRENPNTSTWHAWRLDRGVVWHGNFDMLWSFKGNPLYTICITQIWIAHIVIKQCFGECKQFRRYPDISVLVL